ncbi:S-adenosylmethionine sensor upstream of mTORC1 [Cylas formicarius]|uniref:S-adenosylmethionine sensor upstream of mTORC1 n=1 Tax=Cylas formicarius TaxID=197179 RepID=UPI002958B521|nr:S-adenosylmethionine sensor upstream of mTORC1 [Cylas formicarius]
MASLEHISLANFIKSVHKKLREEAVILGVEEAWQSHCNDSETLKQYSNAMKSLATEYWETRCMERRSAYSRIDWVFQSCKEYFLYIHKYRDKEVSVSRKHNIEKRDIVFSSFGNKLKLLDVGSCYNPFKQFLEFEVTAIDIAPASSEVFKCDFLTINVDRELIIEDKVISLRESSFDIVVFCLLLEYLPSSNQRFECCQKAYQLLKPEGILVIITPDSKHVGANAKLMKSWRLVLAKMGFMRVKYEKLTFLHCMIFRKAAAQNVAQRWADVHADGELWDQIFIPQDFLQKISNRVVQYGDIWCTDTFLQSLDPDVLN